MSDRRGVSQPARPIGPADEALHANDPAQRSDALAVDQQGGVISACTAVVQ